MPPEPPSSRGTWAIDPVHSSIEFSVRHLMVSKVRGRFDELQRRDRRRRGRHPIGDRRDCHRLDQHAERAARCATSRRADFFDVEKYPTATFNSTGVRADGDKYALDGEFTLKGVTKPVTLDLVFNGTNPGMGHGEVAGFEASVVLNRKDFGIAFDAPLETGGTVVGDKVTITLEIEALKQA